MQGDSSRQPFRQLQALYHQQHTLCHQTYNNQPSDNRIRIRQPKTPTLASRSAYNLHKISQLKSQFNKKEQQYKDLIKDIIGTENKLFTIIPYETLYQNQPSLILKIRIKQTGNHYALKKKVIDQNNQNRQENICRKLKSNFIVDFKDIYKEQGGKEVKLNLMMELYNWNLKEFIMHKIKVNDIMLKVLCYQMARAIFYLQSKHITHRHLKPEKFLMKKNGKVVLSGFGLAKIIKKGQLSSNQINSISYRAPELLLGHQNYTSSIDIWALGCIFGELFLKKQLFGGSTVIDAILNITRVFGYKDLKKLKGDQQLSNIIPKIQGNGLKSLFEHLATPDFTDLLTKMLQINPNDRITAVDILVHPFFDELRQEQTYREILRQYVGISGFFIFSKDELNNFSQHKAKLIPVWKKQRPNTNIQDKI